MSEEQIHNQLHVQVGRAREALGEALGQLQDIRQPGLDVGLVSAALAQAVKALFSAESGWTVDVTHVETAMNRLRRTLTLLQDLRSDHKGLLKATATIARTLAILFPVARALQQPQEDIGPIPLTRQLSRDDSQEPLPLTIRRAAVAAPEPAVVEERRAVRRREVVAELGFQSETNFYTGLTVDISSGGLFVATYDVPPVGTPVNVNFDLPGGPMMSLDGTVCWVREYNSLTPDMVPGIGVSFEDLCAADEAAINDYLARSSPLLYEDISE